MNIRLIIIIIIIIILVGITLNNAIDNNGTFDDYNARRRLGANDMAVPITSAMIGIRYYQNYYLHHYHQIINIIILK